MKWDKAVKKTMFAVAAAGLGALAAYATTDDPNLRGALIAVIAGLAAGGQNVLKHIND